MSKYEAVTKFFEETKTNESLRAALTKTKSEDDVIEVAKKFGYDFTRSDVAAAKQEKYGAVDDDAMSGVAGGVADDGGIDYTADPLRYWGTERYNQYWHRPSTGKTGGGL